MKEIKKAVEMIVESIKILGKEKDEMENALYLARLLKKDLLFLGRVRYAEFPWVENKAPTRDNIGLRQAVSVFCEITEESDTLVYYAGCGCCRMDVWAKEIAKSSAKKVVLVRDSRTAEFHQEYFNKIREMKIELVDISIKEKEEVEK